MEENEKKKSGSKEESSAKINLRESGDTNDWSGSDWLRIAFVVAYYSMTLATFAVHIWVTIRGWKADGVGWGIGYFGFFIYSEIYWCYRSTVESGVSFFSIASGLSGLWWINLFLFKKRLSSWLSNEKADI